MALIGLWGLGLFIQMDGKGSASAREAQAKPTVRPYAEVRPFFEKYCFDCHSGDLAEEGFALDQVSRADDIVDDRQHWERVHQLVKVGAMPPSDAEQPTDKEREEIVAWLDHTLYYVDCDAPHDPGRVTIRRLNRTEYNNTIRDLIGVDFKPANDFPSDDVGYGFDNIGDVLTMPPLLVEKYLSAAEEITARAIVTSNSDYNRTRVAAKDLNSKGAVQEGPYETKALVSQGTVSAMFTFPETGKYVVRVRAGAQQAGDEFVKFALSIEGLDSQVHTIKTHEEPELIETQLQVPAGKRRVGVTFLNDYYNPKAKGRKDRNLFVGFIEVEGPLGLPAELPESHRRLIAVTPTKSRSVEEAARNNLRRFLERAFRRPVSNQEVDKYTRFVKLAVDRGHSFERGMQVAIQAALCSPQFLFRVETDKRAGNKEKRHSLNDFELASRLSYFLWSSMPDDELFQLARQGTLHQDAVLDQQVERMLDDPKAQALVENFSGQWLGLRKLSTNEVEPDPELFPEFDEHLRQDIGKETELFFGHIVSEDRSILELLNGRYTFVNERLAKLYGIVGVKGEKFRKVPLTDGRRAGVMTQASILTLTSYPNRTSPVKRGEWVLSNLLGDKPPDPPPVVPALEETQQKQPDLPLRKQLEIHRSDPGCASCHQVMDEIGFGLENFDAIGRWREKENGHPIDSRGTLPTGETFSNPAELTEILIQRKEAFGRCFSEKMLTYALGRGVEYYDRCTLNELVQALQQNDYRFSALVKAIVKSEPFRLRRTDENP